jgi:hypothetical protein
MRQQFAAHCNKRVRFNDEGPARWYLGTQYDRDPITGAVSASQELYINKLLARWHMSDCNPTKIPCSGKLDEIMTSLQQVPAVPNPALLKEDKELVGSLLFLQTGTVPEISWIVSVLARYMTKAGETPHGRSEKGTSIPSISQKDTPQMVRYRQRPAKASFTATPTLPSPTFPTHVCPQSATSSSSTEVPYHGAQQKHHCRCLTQPRPRSSVSAQQHRNASFFANYASKWASTSTVRRSSTKTAKLPSLSLMRHASESAQNTLPFAGTL